MGLYGLVNRPNIGKHILRPNVWSEQVELAGDLFGTYCFRTFPKSGLKAIR